MAGKYTTGDFYRFLELFKTRRTGAFTHTSLGPPLGSYYLPAEKEAEFKALYSQAVSAGEPLHITEKHRDIGPILLDFDFRYPVASDEPVRIYKRDHIKSILQIYTKHLEDFYPLADCRIYVFEKPQASLLPNGVGKDGIHVIIPDIVTPPSVQYIIRERCLPELQALFSEVGFSNPASDIFDNAVIEKNNWLMYGSCKPNGLHYQVSRTYVYTNGKLRTAADTATFSQHVELFSIRNKYTANGIKFEMQQCVTDFEEHLLAEQKRKTAMSQALRTIAQDQKNEVDNLPFIERLVDILSISRADRYEDWIRVGWCLRIIDYRLLPAWISFSQKSEKYTDGECEKLWDYMKTSGLGIGTLRMWAKTDAPEEYERIVREDWRELMMKASTLTDYDIAKVVHIMYKYDYVCANITKNSWYQFRNHRWERIDSGYTLRQHMSNEVAKEFLKLNAKLSLEAAEIDDDDMQKPVRAKSEKMMKVANALKTTSKKNNVIKECGELFYVEKFEERLDSYVNLIGFRNGVYDLDLGEFREGRPDDLLSFCTGINYIPYAEDNPLNAEVLDFMHKVLPKEHIFEYVMKLYASFLHGAVKEEKFHIWTGSGCHALDTQILMYDGSVRAVQDIEVGEQLMGDDSTPRTVERLWRGHSAMYRIVPSKGEPFTVNGAHKLALKVTNAGMPRIYKHKDTKFLLKYTKRVAFCEVSGHSIKKINKAFDRQEDAMTELHRIVAEPDTNNLDDTILVTVDNYLAYNLKSENWCVYRVGVEYEERPVELDPYMLGQWLGDGNSQGALITTMEQEVIDYFNEKLSLIDCSMKPGTKQGKALTYCIAKSTPSGTNIGGRVRKDANKFNIALRNYNLVNNKHIPEDYLLNTREVRLQVLAGIIDSDGHLAKNSSGSNNYELTLKNKQLLTDTVRLAKSLGFAAYSKEIKKTCTNSKTKAVGTYYRTQILGVGMEQIPSLLERKRAQPYDKARNPLRVGFKVEQVEDADYYGFQVNGNHLYLLSDFTTSCNSNGKSKSVELFQKSFGQYCGQFNVSMLMQKRGKSNDTNVELVQAKGKRFIVMQETDEKDKMNVGIMKELTGGDMIQARGLFKDPMEFKPQFKLVLVCNTLPEVSADDNGTWRRIRVLDHIAKFVDKLSGKPYEYLLDNSIATKFDTWTETFMSILIEYYKRYAAEGITEPPEVFECTNAYQKANDCYSEYMSENLTDDITSHVTPVAMYEDFKLWWREFVPAQKVPPKSEFTKAISKVYGAAAGKYGWKGLALKNDNGYMKPSEDVDEH